VKPYTGYRIKGRQKKIELLKEKTKQMNNPFKDFTKKEMVCTTAILIGVLWSIVEPQYSDSIFNKTILSVILIKLFW